MSMTQESDVYSLRSVTLLGSTGKEEEWPVNHHAFLAPMYPLFWPLCLETSCRMCKGTHNSILCPKEACYLCGMMGHRDLICPEGDLHICNLTADGNSTSQKTNYTDDLSLVKTVQLFTSRFGRQRFSINKDCLLGLPAQVFYVVCSGRRCIHCNKHHNSMICPSQLCMACGKSGHSISLCPKSE